MPTSTSPPVPTASDKRRHESRLPPLFATATQLLGWQGLTAVVPDSWNLASFGGNDLAGHLRVDDEDGPRLELRWEQPRGEVDLEKSIARFVAQLGRQAKKKKEAFEAAEGPRLISNARKRKAQLVSFGWTGETDVEDDAIAAQGWGVAWKCAECGRIVVAHVIGRGHEKPGKVQAMAGEIVASLECHGSGGWRTWSIFGLQLDVPEEFQMARAKLQTGRLEIEWIKPAPPTPLGLPAALFPGIGPEQRLGLLRVAAANVLLENESLEDWTQRVVARPDKRRRFGALQETTPETTPETTVRGHRALLLHGVPRDWRRRAGRWLLDRLWRRRTLPAELRVWRCEASNKIFALDTELSPANAHVTADVLDSLECHR